jgi:transcriptional regulator with XRE-family HTH domain
MGRVGLKIQSLRQKHSITIRALAEAVGKTAGYLSRVETRGEIPSPELLCQIAEVLKEEPETLIGLAKQDQLQRVEEQIEQKATEALSLYRRSKK